MAPSDTVPSEISLITGVLPSQQALSLPDAAAKDGLKVAAVYWPNTGRAQLAFNFPQVPQQGRDVAFDAVAGKASPTGVIDSIEKASLDFRKTCGTTLRRLRPRSGSSSNAKQMLSSCT